MIMIVIWTASLWVLMIFCVPIIFFIWKTITWTPMIFLMVFIIPISISIPSLPLSHSGGMPVYTVVTESTRPISVEPTYFLTFFPYVFTDMAKFIIGWGYALFKNQHFGIYFSMDPPPDIMSFVFIHPTGFKRFTSGYHFGCTHGKQNCEGTTIVSIFLLCARRLYILGAWVFVIALFDETIIHFTHYLFCVGCIGAPTRVHVVPGVALSFIG